MKLSRLLALLFCIFLFASCIIVQDIGLITPTNLNAYKVQGKNAVVLTWDDNSENEDGFVIERSMGSNFVDAYTSMTVGPNVEIYLDSDLYTHVNTPITYVYRVYAYKGNNKSSYSNIALVEY